MRARSLGELSWLHAVPLLCVARDRVGVLHDDAALVDSTSLIVLAFRQGFAYRGDPVHRAAARWLGASAAVAFSIAMYAFLVSLVYGAQGIGTSYRWVSIPLLHVGLMVSVGRANHAVDEERLRIASDRHDDLGARLLMMVQARRHTYPLPSKHAKRTHRRGPAGNPGLAR